MTRADSASLSVLTQLLLGTAQARAQNILQIRIFPQAPRGLGDTALAFSLDNLRLLSLRVTAPIIRGLRPLRWPSASAARSLRRWRPTYDPRQTPSR